MAQVYFSVCPRLFALAACRAGKKAGAAAKLSLAAVQLAPLCKKYGRFHKNIWEKSAILLDGPCSFLYNKYLVWYITMLKG